MPAPVSFVQVSREDRPRVSVAYERRGSGEPLVLLHGIGHHRQAWEPVMDALAASHEVIALDLPGFGQSPALPDGGPYGAEALASVLADVFVELDLDRPHVVGNSLGGLIALHLGRAGLARSVTAFSPAGFWTEAERRWTFALLLAMRAGARALPDAALTRLA
ncbi:alpha/beta fold hydrolase, partial [Streptomyces sparsus]